MKDWLLQQAAVNYLYISAVKYVKIGSAARGNFVCAMYVWVVAFICSFLCLDIRLPPFFRQCGGKCASCNLCCCVIYGVLRRRAIQGYAPHCPSGTCSPPRNFEGLVCRRLVGLFFGLICSFHSFFCHPHFFFANVIR